MIIYSILGRIIRVTDEVVEYRHWIKDNFPINNSQSLPRVVPLFSRPVPTGVQQIPYIPGPSQIYPYTPYPQFSGAPAAASTGSSGQSSRSSSSPPETFGDPIESNRSSQVSPVDAMSSKSGEQATLPSTLSSASGDETMITEENKDQQRNKEDSASVSSLSIASESGGNNSFKNVKTTKIKKKVYTRKRCNSYNYKV